jgi:hypothetical protein
MPNRAHGNRIPPLMHGNIYIDIYQHRCLVSILPRSEQQRGTDNTSRRITNTHTDSDCSRRAEM